MPVTGWVIGSIVAGVLGTLFVLITVSMNKMVHRDRIGKIDFRKSDVYFRWNRWDTVMVLAAAYTFFCICGLLVFLLRGDNINHPWIQFFIHQTFVFSLITWGWYISRIAITLRGIRERWSDDIQ